MHQHQWKVIISPKAEKELKQLIQSDQLSLNDQLVIAAWAREICSDHYRS